MKSKKLYDLYLSGPMTGVPDLNRPAFNKMAKALRYLGYSVVNPPELDLNEPQRSWEGCLRRDIKHLMNCKAIATLPRWNKSKGALLEVFIGKALSYPIKSADHYLKSRKRRS